LTNYLADLEENFYDRKEMNQELRDYKFMMMDLKKN